MNSSGFVLDAYPLMEILTGECGKLSISHLCVQYCSGEPQYGDNRLKSIDSRKAQYIGLFGLREKVVIE